MEPRDLEEDKVFSLENEPNALAITSNKPANQPKSSHKKIIIMVVAVIVIIGASVGGYFLYQNYAEQQARQQAAQEAKLKAEKEAAFQRQGTVREIEESFQVEFKQEADEDSRLIFSAGDNIQREATAAGFVGENNATGL